MCVSDSVCVCVGASSSTVVRDLSKQLADTLNKDKGAPIQTKSISTVLVELVAERPVLPPTPRKAYERWVLEGLTPAELTAEEETTM